MKLVLHFKVIIILLILATTVGCSKNDNDTIQNNDHSPIVEPLNQNIGDDQEDSFKSRRKNLFYRVKDDSMVVFYSGVPMHRTNDQFYRFEPNRNFYYLTGLKEANMILLMHKSNTNANYLFIEENDEVKMKWEGAKLTKEEASNISGIDISNIFYIDEFDQFIYSTLETDQDTKPIDLIYLDVLSGNESVNILANTFNGYVKENYPDILVGGINDIIGNMRMYKSEKEIDEIKKAIEYTKEGIEQMITYSKSGLYEYQLESYFNQILTYNNSYESFKLIVASGNNATVLHYDDNTSLIEDNSFILMDVGAQSNYYAADITRTIPVNGKFSDRQREIYEIVLKANKETIKQIKPGVTWTELQNLSKSILSDGLKELGIIKDDNELINYYFHSIGHHLGLDVHDGINYNKPLQEGMVITIEPGLYIPEENIGVRIEDDILVTKDGYENLSENIIKEIDDIEQFMVKN